MTARLAWWPAAGGDRRVGGKADSVGASVRVVNDERAQGGRPGGRIGTSTVMAAWLGLSGRRLAEIAAITESVATVAPRAGIAVSDRTRSRSSSSGRLLRLDLPAPAKPSCPRRQGGPRHDHTAHRDRRHHAPHHVAKLDEAAAIGRAAEGCAADGQPARELTIALDVEPLTIEANQLLQGLAILSRIAREAAP